MRITLDGEWTLAYGPADAPATPQAAAAWPTLPAQVPGAIALDLVAAGLAADPAVGDGAWRLRAWEAHAWWYRRSIDIPAIASGDTLQLECGAIDGLASVWLDGVCIGTAANGLIPHTFPLLGVAPGPHALALRLEAVVVHGRRRPVPLGEFHVHAFGWESLALRRPAHVYGWDILPRLALGGLPRSVMLATVPPVRLREVAWSTLAVDVDRAQARIQVTWDAVVPAAAIGRWRLRCTLAHAGQVVWSHEALLAGAHGRSLGTVCSALWWPRGWGDPALHEAVVELVDADGEVQARDVRAIGLRTIALERTEGTACAPGIFAVVVNGSRCFVRGTNWVPLDALHARDAAARAAALAALWDSGSTCVRMWGGSIYEDDEVYDWCDRHGILVWQDFALACAVLPQDAAFQEALATEAAAVIRRLRHHACVALWCGGNETDLAYQWAGLGQDPATDVLTRTVLPTAVRTHDPMRPYLPSSPYLSPAAMAGAPLVEDHLWGPRDDWLGAYYRSSRASFISEIGWHGCPAVASLQAMQPPGTPLWPIAGNPAWLPQAVCAVEEDRAHAYRLPLLASQAALACSPPAENLADFVFASQVSQAEALKSFIETARARKGAMWGLLWWNLRDGWPVISDAVIDAFGRRKLAFEVIARAQAEVVVIIEHPQAGLHRVVAVNDRREAVRIAVEVRAQDDGCLLAWEGLLPGNGIVTIGVLAEHPTHALWRTTWAGDAHGSGHHLCGPRPWPLVEVRRWYARLGLTQDPTAAAASCAGPTGPRAGGAARG